MTTVLVVDADAEVARFVALNLRIEGFEVITVADAEHAREVIRAAVPDLVLLDVLPTVDDLELCRWLRTEPATVHVPVILLTARGSAADQALGLAAGADDYVVKPFDVLELVARIHATLWRNAEMRATSPLTGLPGNHRIDLEIARRVSSGEDYAVCYLDIDNFKAFNDSYGFLRGDEVITLLATVLRSATRSAGVPVPFVGHIGGDDFVLACTPAQAEPICRRAIELFDAGAPALHDARDLERGYLEVPDRQGTVRRYPPVSVSVGVATSGRRIFQDHREVVVVAAEMKAVAKSTPGSTIAVDRRTGPVAPAGS